MHSRWYRTGVIYSLDIGLFQDANGDGIGDIQGLISRLDCLARLRVTTIWLNPRPPVAAAGIDEVLSQAGDVLTGPHGEASEKCRDDVDVSVWRCALVPAATTDKERVPGNAACCGSSLPPERLYGLRCGRRSAWNGGWA
jgi:hypothetical protein